MNELRKSVRTSSAAYQRKRDPKVLESRLEESVLEKRIFRFSLKIHGSDRAAHGSKPAKEQALARGEPP